MYEKIKLKQKHKNARYGRSGNIVLWKNTIKSGK